MRSISLCSWINFNKGCTWVVDLSSSSARESAVNFRADCRCVEEGCIIHRCAILANLLRLLTNASHHLHNLLPEISPVLHLPIPEHNALGHSEHQRTLKERKNESPMRFGCSRLHSPTHPKPKTTQKEGHESLCEGWGPKRAGLRCNHATRHLEERESVIVQGKTIIE
jgi:hypothetical protein